MLLLFFLKCDIFEPKQKKSPTSLTKLFGTSWALLNRLTFCILSSVFFSYQTKFACEWKKYSSLIKKKKRLCDLVMECIELAICLLYLTPTVTWSWPESNVVFLCRGNLTLTCKAQSAAAWECGKVQAWVIPKQSWKHWQQLNIVLSVKLPWKPIEIPHSSDRRCDLWTPW